MSDVYIPPSNCLGGYRDKYFIRHGVSVGNIIKAMGIIKWDSPFRSNIIEKIVANASLAEIGIKHTLEVKKKVIDKSILQNNIIVFCSPMLRAIQTALILFPNSIIYVLPYIGEKVKKFYSSAAKSENTHDTQQITKKKINISKDYLSKQYGILFDNQINYELYNNIISNNSNKSKRRSNIKFINELNIEINKKLTDTDKFIFVGHQNINQLLISNCVGNQLNKIKLPNCSIIHIKLNKLIPIYPSNFSNDMLIEYNNYNIQLNSNKPLNTSKPHLQQYFRYHRNICDIYLGTILNFTMFRIPRSYVMKRINDMSPSNEKQIDDKCKPKTRKRIHSNTSIIDQNF